MNIARLSADRWQDYRDLRLQAVADSPQSFLDTEQETRAQLDTEWHNKIKNMFFAVSDEGELVGMVGCYADSREKLSHIMNVVSFYVQPEWRGQGIGRQLLVAALECAQSQPEIKKVQLGVITTQLPAIELYTSLGFQRVGELQMAVKVGDRLYNEFLMERIV